MASDRLRQALLARPPWASGPSSSVLEDDLGQISMEMEMERIQTKREREREEVEVLSRRHTPSSTILVVPSNSTDHLAAANDTKLIEKEVLVTKEAYRKAKHHIDRLVMTPESVYKRPPNVIPDPGPTWEEKMKTLAAEEGIKKYGTGKPFVFYPLVFRGEDPTSHPPAIRKVEPPMSKKQRDKLAKEKKGKGKKK